MFNTSPVMRFMKPIWIYEPSTMISTRVLASAIVDIPLRAQLAPFNRPRLFFLNSTSSISFSTESLARPMLTIQRKFHRERRLESTLTVRVNFCSSLGYQQDIKFVPGNPSDAPASTVQSDLESPDWKVTKDLERKIEDSPDSPGQQGKREGLGCSTCSK